MSRTSIGCLRKLYGAYKNPFVVQLGPQPPARLDRGLWAWWTSCWNEVLKPWRDWRSGLSKVWGKCCQLKGFPHGKVEQSWLLSLPNTEGVVWFSLGICKDSPSSETKAEFPLEDDSEQKPNFLCSWSPVSPLHLTDMKATRQVNYMSVAGC